MEYRMEGKPFPIVMLSLREGESIDCQAGAMAWMSPNMQMSTSAKKGGRRFLTRESIFKNTYTAVNGGGNITFSSKFPGEIREFHITPGCDMILQSGAYLASTSGVDFSVYHHDKMSTAFFGGEGLFMERLSGQGIAFAELDGYVQECQLSEGETLIVSSGYIAMMTGECTINIQKVHGAKNAWFGGQGFFNTEVHGPGTVWLQSMPVKKMAAAVAPYIESRVQNTQSSNND